MTKNQYINIFSKKNIQPLFFEIIYKTQLFWSLSKKSKEIHAVLSFKN